MVSLEISDVIDSQSSKLGKKHSSSSEQNCPKISRWFKSLLRQSYHREIRGIGLILGIKFVDNNSPNDPFPPEWGVGAYFGAQSEKEGMLVRVAGDNIMMSPPFIMSHEEVGELISKYGKATEKRVKELKSQHKKQ
ncbi:hypothetical protein OIU78_020114 [Salix suchowensis]|nr:hypothetical protein OIU78_020114 [Salix suchowensis]